MPTEADNLYMLGEDDGSLVITLINPPAFNYLIREARLGPLGHLLHAGFRTTMPEHDLVAHDFDQAYGLLLIPPLLAPVSTLSFEALRNECERRRIGVIPGRLAYALARICNSRGPLATELAFAHVLLTPQYIEYLREDIAANSHDREGTYIDLNNKTDRGVQNLMGALLRRWAKYVRVVGQPDELAVAELALRMTSLRSLSWEHPTHDAVQATTAGVVMDQDIIFNIPGLQGLALGNRVNRSIRLSITGLPLYGLCTRLQTFVKVDPNADIEGDPVPPLNPNDETMQPYDILRDSVRHLVKIECLVDAPIDPTDRDIHTNFAPAFRTLDEPPTAQDMAALKQTIIAAHKLDSLSIKRNNENPADGRAGAYIPHSALNGPGAADTGFYLPAFVFNTEDRFPPLRQLHLWRYNWRQHSVANVETNWNLRHLHDLNLECAPLRWFLGTIRMADLRFLECLRLEDAEWELHPDESRQAALIIGYLLTFFVYSLRVLELIRVYTDHVPIVALQRHAPNLEHLALRHPFGIGFGPGGVSSERASRMLLNMLRRRDLESPENAVSVHFGHNAFGGTDRRDMSDDEDEDDGDNNNNDNGNGNVTVPSTA